MMLSVFNCCVSVIGCCGKVLDCSDYLSPSQKRKQIEENFNRALEHFMDWVNSNGTDYKDWYK